MAATDTKISHEPMLTVSTRSSAVRSRFALICGSYAACR
jgi:hypothetical protein